jgi:hypothetical protein
LKTTDVKCKKIITVNSEINRNPPLRPYKAKRNEKWELIAFLFNNFFQKSRLKNKSPGVSNSGFTVII